VNFELTQEQTAMSDTTTTPETADTELTPTDRRALLRKIAIGGAGAAAGAVMLSNGRASAADGGNMILGQENDATLPTILDFTPTTPPTEGPSAFSAGGYVPPATSPFPAGVGGYGDETIANGVHGSTTAASGFGVVAANLAPNPDASTAPTTKALAIASSGAHVLFVPGAKTGPANGTHVAGELYVDAQGTLWFTVPAPTATDDDAVRFVKLAGTPTTGSFHAISPQRAYDSRQAAYAVSGVMAPNTNRVISVADGHGENGAVTLANAVPAGATAVQINLTAANMTAPNFLQVAAGNVTTVTASVLNWGPGDIQIANAVTVPVDASRQIKVFCGNQTGSTHVIVDVFGYYL
jgi:hypothetical protein